MQLRGGGPGLLLRQFHFVTQKLWLNLIVGGGGTAGFAQKRAALDSMARQMPAKYYSTKAKIRNPNDETRTKALMKYCDLSLPSPAENLACDEALLDLCEGGQADEVLRVWEPSHYFVVLGYADKISTEVNLAFCEENTLPILRRCTGGGTVLQGPGVLNYSLMLRIGESVQSIPATNGFILRRHQAALGGLLRAPVEMQGQTDLAIGGLKFSGNAQRRRKRFLIFHGSFLLNLDFDLLEKILPMPSRQPDYRANRSHSDFLMNLHVPAQTIKAALVKTWSATETPSKIPLDDIKALALEKYARDDWNRKF
jgi:lipoate-protein ligase A